MLAQTFAGRMLAHACSDVIRRCDINIFCERMGYGDAGSLDQRSLDGYANCETLVCGESSVIGCYSYLWWFLASCFREMVNCGSMGMHRYVCFRWSEGDFTNTFPDYSPFGAFRPLIVHPRQCFNTPYAIPSQGLNSCSIPHISTNLCIMSVHLPK